MEQFTNSCSGSSHKPHYKIPFIITICLESGFEKFIICITDYVFQKILLLYLYKLHFQFFLLCKLQILVNSLQTKIDSLRFEVFD